MLRRDSSLYFTNFSRMTMFMRLSAQYGGGHGGSMPPVCQAKATGHLRADVLVSVRGVSTSPKYK